MKQVCDCGRRILSPGQVLEPHHVCIYCHHELCEWCCNARREQPPDFRCRCCGKEEDFQDMAVCSFCDRLMCSSCFWDTENHGPVCVDCLFLRWMGDLYEQGAGI